ncbi:MAG: hypothetical protein ACT4OV_15565 [Microthrixaceae bacterium]
MADEFAEADVAAAVRLDAEIGRALGGDLGDADETITWLVAAMRVDPPAALAARVEADHERRERARWRPLQIVAAVFAVNLLSHGIGDMFVGGWVSRSLGEHYSPHAFREGGFALIAAGVAVGAAAVRRSWIPVSVAAGVPLGVSLGIYGLPEVGEFGAGAALHLTQGALGVALGVTWWRGRRYTSRSRIEGGT